MKADIHVHTNHSFDGFSTPEEVVDAAIKKGLSYIVITDHNTIEGAEKARDYAEGKGISVIIGEEVSCKEGDVLAINIKREIPKGLSVREAVKRIHDQGGFAVAPHPFFPMSSIGMLAFTSDFDAVEGYNGLDYSGEKQARRLCRQWGMPMTAGSDAHYAEDVGNYCIEFKGDFFDSLVSGNFKTHGKKTSLGKVLLWQTKVIFRLMRKKSPKFLKSDNHGKKTEPKKRAGDRRKSREESF